MFAVADDPRREPVSVKVLLTSGEGVRIDWRDGHQSHYPFPYLRQHCPCATCREVHRTHPEKAGAGTNPLPLYQEPAKAVRAQPIGNYAVQFFFSDGHSTGIYSFEYFRDICPCAACQAEREGERK